ncbi:hypothetical protein BJ878DRAFT_15763 [Calycina marina]|uniref:Oxysterol-binding protein n=1 Tax=Calycina marina TaxID=1763456 RepID=A0A9P7ZAZ0_9HELO|nr:hypothetical protein BJ878DRAFT_15763 [Calycina marina]
MVGIHSHRRASGANSGRSSIDEARSDCPDDEEPDQGNVLGHIISQLRPGADLSRVVLPTFILEPRSMLERITNFMAHPETLLPMPETDDPTLRFVSVVKFYLSGWHIRPPGVKKPLNPILGETFTCYWEFPDNTKGYYISEQTSHHPPKSSYFYMAPEHNIRIDGTLKPRSKFLGNSAASLMEGIAVLRLLNRGKGSNGESYFLTQPNMYARGILFGKMKYELGDHSFVRCPELGLSADIEFKTKGYFGGTYNSIGGEIKTDSGEVLYQLSGMWSGEMVIKDMRTGKKDVLFNATNAKPTAPIARPLEEQNERESQKLWYNTAQAVKRANHLLATDEKTRVEDRQRDEAAKRAEDGVDWHPKLFRAVRGGPGGEDEGEEDLEWILNATINGKNSEEIKKQILAAVPILPGQKANEKNSIPPPHTKPEIVSPQPARPAAPVAPKAAEGDLIDLGGDSATPAVSSKPVQVVPSHFPSDLKVAQTQNNGQQQKDLEDTLRATSTSPSADQQQSSLNDFHRDLFKNLSPAPGLKSEDTDTKSVDEFLDAEG